MLVEAIKIAAGKHSFVPGQQIELPTKEAQELIAANAVVKVSKDGELDFGAPKSKAKQPTTPKAEE